MHTSGKKKHWKLQCKRIIELIICFKDGIPFSYFSRDKFRKTLRIFSRVFNHFTKNISAIISNGKGSLCFIPQTPEIRPTQQVIQKILMQILQHSSTITKYHILCCRQELQHYKPIQTIFKTKCTFMQICSSDSVWSAILNLIIRFLFPK